MLNITNVAANIRKVRLFRNYSQDYLAFKLKLSQNAYSKIELGYSRITVDKLLIIAQALEVRPADLIEEADIPTEVGMINQISIIPKLLEIVCRTTGMGFAAVAHVTERKWIACAVRDEISFGLRPGEELKIETTLCDVIRRNREPIVIDHVDHDKTYASHITPAMYGFQSYISIPIIRKDGTFFGTLCAIDPKPAKVNNPETIGMFKLFADLISFHLQEIRKRSLPDEIIN